MAQDYTRGNLFHRKNLMFVNHTIPLPRLLAAILIALVTVSSTHGFLIPQRQSGSVSHLRGSQLIDQQNSTEFGPLNLEANNTFNEAQMFVDYPPASAPWQGVHGTIYVSAIADDGDDRTSLAVFEYDFELENPVEYFIRYTKQGDAQTRFELLSDLGVEVSLNDEQQIFLQGRFEPGNYEFSIEITAFSPFISNPIGEQDFAQIDFALFFSPVPEPNTLVLTGLLLILLLGRHCISRI